MGLLVGRDEDVLVMLEMLLVWETTELDWTAACFVPLVWVARLRWLVMTRLLLSLLLQLEVEEIQS